MKIKISLIDDDGKIYEGEVELKKKSKQDGYIKITDRKTSETWYKKGSTIEKIIDLINENFFDKNRSMINIIGQLKTKDFHLKPSDLTLPLRKVVRKGLLRRTKDLPDGNKSKQWTYVKI